MPEIARATTADRVREARQAAGLSQQALATAAGLATKTVARIELGEDTRLATLAAVAEALGLSMVDLMPDQRAS